MTLHGVSFTQIPPGQRDALSALLFRKRMVWQGVVRIPMDLPVLCQPKGQIRPILQGRTENASRRGLLLRLPSVISPGNLLDVVLRTSQGTLATSGKVVRVEPMSAQTPGVPIRHGFQFTTVSHAADMSLSQVLSESL